eukprot:scaffold59881_cov48-Phaeocystis_antarctica.AAC.3
MAVLAWSRGRIPIPECIYSHRVRNQVWAYTASLRPTARSVRCIRLPKAAATTAGSSSSTPTI